MLKKSKEGTFSYFRRESPLQEQGVYCDSLHPAAVNGVLKHPVNLIQMSLRPLFKNKESRADHKAKTHQIIPLDVFF
jgi:hypothetical protein